MKEQLTELLNTLYEAEGLVEMALRRKVQAPDRIVRLALEKCFMVARLASEVDLPQTGHDDDMETDDRPFYGDGHECAGDVASEDDVHGDDTCVGACEEKEVEVFTQDILPHIADKDSDAAVSGSHLPDGGCGTGLPLVRPYAVVSEKGHTPPPEDDDTHACEAGAGPSVAACRDRKPVMAFLSVNDKFRFRRGLFAGSDTDFRDALASFGEMEDICQAREHMFGTLGWDPEDPDVKSFVDILERYYR